MAVRFLRYRVRTLIFVVAFVALSLAGLRLAQRVLSYGGLAKSHRNQSESHRVMLAALESNAEFARAAQASHLALAGADPRSAPSHRHDARMIDDRISVMMRARAYHDAMMRYNSMLHDKYAALARKPWRVAPPDPTPPAAP